MPGSSSSCSTVAVLMFTRLAWPAGVVSSKLTSAPQAGKFQTSCVAVVSKTRGMRCSFR